MGTESGEPLPPPPQDPDNDVPLLTHLTMAWNRELKCRYNLVVADCFVDAFLDSEYGPALPELTSMNDQPETDLRAIKKAVNIAFWIHIKYLYGVYKLQIHPQSAALRARARAVDRRRKRLVRVSLFIFHRR